MGHLTRVLRDEIAAAGGRIPFARFMEVALYHPEHGYYLAPARRPGRGGDFLTAPEASAYFGLTLARQVAECWERLGRPARLDVREYGAGVGVLAYDILAGLSEEDRGLFEGVGYRLVEPNPHRRAEALAGMEEAGLLGSVVAEDPDDELEPITGVVIANEVADAMPVHRLVGRDGGFGERWVVGRGEGFAWEDGPLSPGGRRAAEELRRSGVDPEPGAVYDASPAAADWFERACRSVERGYAVVVDYGYPARELYRDHRLGGTLRAYAGHTVSDDLLAEPGERDLTAHVDLTALARAGERAGMVPAGVTTQGAFLASLGLGDRLVELQRDPDAAFSDYLAAQTVVLRLIDPGGLGRFRVLLMAKGAPVEPPLLGLRERPPPF